MRAGPSAPSSIDEYIAGFPGDVQVILGRIRTTIRRAAPRAEEPMRYQMPHLHSQGQLDLLRRLQEAYWALSCLNKNQAIQQEAVYLSGSEVNGEVPIG